MIRLVLLAFAFSVVSVAASAQDQPLTIQLEASLASTTLHPGDSTDIILKFDPSEDIHLNAEPAVRVEFDSASILEPIGALRQEIDTEAGTVKTSEPLRQRVALSRKAGPGRHSVRGTVTYFFCSGTEGWCRRKAQWVQLQVTALARP